MSRKSWLCMLACFVVFAAISWCQSSTTQADEWGRYYHWPYSGFQTQQWTPYEYQQVYDGNHRYPSHLRRYPKIDEWRNWSTAKKPYYRGYHFILDQF